MPDSRNCSASAALPPDPRFWVLCHPRQDTKCSISGFHPGLHSRLIDVPSLDSTQDFTPRLTDVPSLDSTQDFIPRLTDVPSLDSTQDFIPRLTDVPSLDSTQDFIPRLRCSVPRFLNSRTSNSHPIHYHHTMKHTDTLSPSCWANVRMSNSRTSFPLCSRQVLSSSFNSLFHHWSTWYLAVMSSAGDSTPPEIHPVPLQQEVIHKWRLLTANWVSQV